MNQGRIWCVVKPTVGLPLFLGAVATTSLIVHAAVLTHTTWYGALYQGGKAKTALGDSSSSVAALTSDAKPAFVVAVTPVADSSGKAGASFVVTVTPNTGAASYTVGDASPVEPARQTVAMTSN